MEEVKKVVFSTDGERVTGVWSVELYEGATVTEHEIMEELMYEAIECSDSYLEEASGGKYSSWQEVDECPNNDGTIAEKALEFAYGDVYAGLQGEDVETEIKL